MPVVVIGAGPVGLAAAAHLVRRGQTPLVLEAGNTVGAGVLGWGHVRVFSPWRYIVDPASSALLADRGWEAPVPDGYPTGSEIVDAYLRPLSEHPAIGPNIRLGTRVLSVTRRGFDKMKTDGRRDAPFALRIDCPDGSEAHVLAGAVIDASGTWARPNPLGSGGAPAVGEVALASHIHYGIPDVLGAQRDRYAGKRVLVVGSGHSAFNALLDLVRLASEAPGTDVTWAVRGSRVSRLFGGGEDDQLPARGELGQRVHGLVEAGALRVVTDFRTERLSRSPDGSVELRGEDGRALVADEIIAATGFRPDLSMLRELRLDLDEVVEAPRALAPLIDPNVHSCGTVPPHGEAELAHQDEPGYYTGGMKSYGRAPTFLMLTSYEQVRSVVAALSGDLEAARRVELVLPETGVCSGPIGDTDVSCCASGPDAVAPEPVAAHATTPVPQVLDTPRGNPLTVVQAGGSCCG